MNAKNTLLELSAEDLALLNSPLGLKQLFADKKVDLYRALRLAKYEERLRELQAELIKVQNSLIENNKKVVVLFEGRDAAGKGGAIRRISAQALPHCGPS
jgi:polyphosphate kinase 2 (PPK2 family)